jgi:hypothetical protein
MMKFSASALVGSLAVLLSTVVTQAAQPAVPGEVPVRVDERVELLSIVFRLQGAFEYHQTRDTVPYARAVDRYFAPFKDHEAIKLAGKLRDERAIAFDAVAWFAVHLTGGPRLAPKVAFDNKKLVMDSRWTPATAAAFLLALQKFADDSKAFDFFEKHRGFYARSARRLAQEMARRPYRAWLNGFFGGKPGSQFCAIVGLLNGGANYAATVRVTGGRQEILPIIGAGKFDDDGLPVFDKDSAGTIAHEFCHAYCNPLVDRFADKLMPWGVRIYERRAGLLKPQMYGSAQIMLYEALVRACTHRFLTKHGTAQEAAEQIRDEVRRGFVWTAQLSKLLAEYETARDKYATLEAFMPRVVAFFEGVATDMDRHLAQLPRVKRLTPAGGSKDVDPGATELRIEFDRRMDRKAAGLFGQKSDLPMLIGQGRFSHDGRTFVQPIKLVAGKTYKISINTVWSPGFSSADGWPLDPVQWTFTTRKK